MIEVGLFGKVLMIAQAWQMQDEEVWRGCDQIQWVSRKMEEFESGTEGVWRSESQGRCLLFATAVDVSDWVFSRGTGFQILLLEQ
jgi:hypothetical protein